MMIFIFLLILVLLYCVSRESFSPDNKEDMDLIRGIQRFVYPTTQYEDYIEFLTNNDNQYPKLADFTTFVVLQNLKKIGELTVDNIAKFMTNEE